MFYAHISSSNQSEKKQPLEEHLRQVAQRLLEMPHVQEILNAKMQAQSVAYLHDIGKAAPEFQSYLQEATRFPEKKTHCSINHSEAGAAWANKNLPSPWNQCLPYLIAGHHAGLPDYDDGGPGVLRARLQQGEKNLRAIEKNISPLLQNLSTHMEDLAHLNFPNQNNAHIWLRMLFSALVDADWLDTEQFMDPNRHAQRPQFPPLETFKAKFDAFMEPFSKKIPDGEKARLLHQSRNQILELCRQAGRGENHRCYTLQVPTGGGKTLSSLAFALEHAIRYSRDRIIYVIPYTSIIEQTADTFRKIFGDENVLEHHSNLDVTRQDQEVSQKLELASENWDAPLIVTTNVQFFESLMASKPSPCRKLHRMMNSVVILDEVQMLPPNYLSVFNHLINELSQSFKMTFLLCSATQPALDMQENSDFGSIEKPIPLCTPTPIIQSPQDFYDDLQRTTLEIRKKSHSWEAIAEEMMPLEQVLCIVNTRKDAYHLYQILHQQTEHKESLFHLSALMCGEHRTQVIEIIKQRLSNQLPVQVVSTSLVEAGVDIDFPIVYRAMAGLDSILQSAGRCNREGKLPKLGNVVVFRSETAVPKGMPKKGFDAFQEIMTEDLQNPDTYRHYSELFYNKVNKTGKSLLKCLTCGKSFYFRRVSKGFQMIDDNYQTILVRWNKQGNELLEELRKNGPSRKVMRRLQRYSVNVPNENVEQLCQEGWLEKLDCGIVIQCREEIYDKTFGMNLYGIPSLPLQQY